MQISGICGGERVQHGHTHGLFQKDVPVLGPHGVERADPALAGERDQGAGGQHRQREQHLARTDRRSGVQREQGPEAVRQLGAGGEPTRPPVRDAGPVSGDSGSAGAVWCHR